MLKKILIAVGLLVAVPLITALFVTNDVVYEKSISVNVPVEQAWQHVNSLSALDKWSPWNEYDPNMKKEWTGTDGTVGAKQSWQSDVDNVGRGSQTITNVEAPTLLETDLKFFDPYESEAKAYVKLAEVDGTTQITWGFKSEIPYPFNLMNLYTDMDDLLGKDWTLGLSKLKKLCEQ